MAAEFKKNRIPDPGDIVVPGFSDLFLRLSAVTFLVAPLSDEEISLLLTAMAKFLPYYRSIIEQLLMERINTESLAIWLRFKASGDANVVGFYAKYNNSEYFKLAYEMGERYHSAFALGKNSSSSKFARDYGEGVRGAAKEDYSTETLKFLEGACHAGNPDAYNVLIPYFLEYKKDYTMSIKLICERLLLGPRLSDRTISWYSECEHFMKTVFFSQVFGYIETLPIAKAWLAQVCATYIAVEEQILIKQMMRHHYVYEEQEGVCWEKMEYTHHKEFLTGILTQIVADFGREGLKMITDYYSESNNKMLTAEILLFLGTCMVSSDHTSESYLIKDDKEAFQMVLQAAELGNRSAYKLLTQSNPMFDRDEIMCDLFRELSLNKSSLQPIGNI
ncbi:MAG: hypothetical protein Harvfovirus1_77 [Harvfovirus sp.]|uniref:Uncharacterized protein n=1 Tax=Harvfovirus sp. TaxID=2487768 RepID=A0A3G4ZZY3_9VIRU|nr:MAG: hypothetical protein Harvfovirus1_77 [Harvfovirus sp.]